MSTPEPLSSPAAAGRAGRRFLVVLRAGDSSLHESWFHEDRTYDLVVDYYGKQTGRYRDSCDVLQENRGSKWRGLHRLLRENPRYLSDYDAVWFPDDDIQTDHRALNAMFALHEELGLALSQPALTLDSYYTHSAVLVNSAFTVRFTNFVEVMVPLFSRAALHRCFDTFDLSESGWGIDLVWQSVLPEGSRCAVMDCVQVRHTRPVGGGTLYDGLEQTPADENRALAERYGVPPDHRHVTYAGLGRDFELLPDRELLGALLEGRPEPTVQPISPWDFYLRDIAQSLQWALSDTVAPGPPARSPRPASSTRAEPPSSPAPGWTVPLVVVAGRPRDRVELSARSEALRAEGFSTALFVAEPDEDDVGRVQRVLEEAATGAAGSVLDVVVSGDQRDVALLRSAQQTGALTVVRVGGHSLLEPSPDGGTTAAASTSALVQAVSLADVVVAAAAARPFAEGAAHPSALVTGGFDERHLRERVGVGAVVEPTGPVVVVVTCEDGEDPGPCLEGIARQTIAPAGVDVVVLGAPAGARVWLERHRAAGTFRSLVEAAPASGAAGPVAAPTGLVVHVQAGHVPAPSWLQEHLAHHRSDPRPDLVVRSLPAVSLRHGLTPAASRFAATTSPGLARWCPAPGEGFPTVQLPRSGVSVKGSHPVVVAAGGAVVGTPPTSAPPGDQVLARRGVLVHDAAVDLATLRREAVLSGLGRQLARPGQRAGDPVPFARQSRSLYLWSRRHERVAAWTAHAAQPWSSEDPDDGWPAGVLGELDLDLDAHRTAGRLIGRAMHVARRDGRPFTIGVDARDVQSVEVLLQADPRCTAVVVVTSPFGPAPEEVEERVTRWARRRRTSLDDLPDVEVRVTNRSPVLEQGLDAVVALHPVETWRHYTPPPLLGLPLPEWLRVIADGSPEHRAGGGDGA
ncbi:hypothetical protein [Kineococcus terrestris]|uniref:hypothetical protein n=1 Tax=Kineococcus terrestris TaxID=2044856 RepID=UPI0034DB2D07